MSRKARHSPEEIWSELRQSGRAGNRRSGDYLVHRPNAAVLSCSDARVPPTVVFDQPAGALFTVRVAGNTASPITIASLDFAVAELSVPLVIVLGHTDCGAALGAVSGNHDWYLEPVVGPLLELAEADPDAGVDEIVERNVIRTMEILAAYHGPTGKAISNRTVDVRGAVYDVRSGEIREISPR